MMVRKRKKVVQKENAVQKENVQKENKFLKLIYFKN